MEFEALVKEIKVKSLVSGDKSIHIVLETHDEEALKASFLPSDAFIIVKLSPKS